jgi:predicted RNA-binding Zn-ribbon protein involved in translation (DUF1610 family)
MTPKIISFDIENSPALGYFFDLWKEGNIVGTKEQGFLLSVAYKELGKKVQSYSLPDFKGYSKDKHNDYQLTKKIWEIFDQADVLIAHNGDRFDIPKVNARFAYWKLPPPSPYKTVDTLKIAKRFGFISNRLHELGKHLGYGGKLVHTGWDMWEKCMNGDMKAWKHMIEYNKRDVVLLEKIYLHFLPYIKNHPNISVMKGMPNGCPNCGSKEITKEGHNYTQAGRVQQYHCKKCGKWSSGKYEKVTSIR